MKSLERVKVRNFLEQLSLEGFDRKKFFLTIKNLKFANENIEFYTKKNLEENVTILSQKNNIILKENFFSQSNEVVFRSLTEVIKL
jgi:tRNA(Ile)-lysidine synthase